MYDGDTTRTAHIFPSLTPQAHGARGSFKLIEDDGKTNDHVERGSFTELELGFHVVASEDGKQYVEVDVKTLHNSYTLPYDVIWFVLPVGDARELRVASGSTRKTSTREADGRRMFGVYLSE